MDEYTAKTRDWLNERFQKVDARGVYIAHQPIYGLKRGAHEPNVTARLSRTFQIMRVLRTLPLASFLDVGAAEGYFTALVRDVFRVPATAFDLSCEAAKRAQELYGLEAVAGDVHALPFADNSFDVVYCSEMIEHVTDPARAIAELIRVARQAVVVTTPYESVTSSLSRAHEHGGEPEPHGHINVFDEAKLRALFPGLVEVVPLRFQPLLYAMVATEGPELPDHVVSRYHPALVRAYRAWQPLARAVFGERLARGLIKLDARLVERWPQQRCDFLAVYQKINELERRTPDPLDDDLLDFILYRHVLAEQPLGWFQEHARTNLNVVDHT